MNGHCVVQRVVIRYDENSKQCAENHHTHNLVGLLIPQQGLRSLTSKVSTVQWQCVCRQISFSFFASFSHTRSSLLSLLLFPHKMKQNSSFHLMYNHSTTQHKQETQCLEPQSSVIREESFVLLQTGWVNSCCISVC